MKYKNEMITDFSNPDFKKAFQIYFAELGVTVKQWDKLFQEMNEEGNNCAYLRLDGNNNVIGFIQFTVISFSSWFFETKLGFVREFWIAKEHRNCGHGTDLLSSAEAYFVSKGLHRSILTTDTAEKFYIQRGYQRDMDISAKNKDAVYLKNLR